MAQLLFVGRDARTFGPFSSSQLRQFAAAGKLRRTDTIWKQGQEQQVVSAAQVKNLFPAADSVKALPTVTPVLVPRETVMHAARPGADAAVPLSALAPQTVTQGPWSAVDTPEPPPGSFENASLVALVPLIDGAQTSPTPDFSEPPLTIPVPADVEPPAPTPEKQKLRRAIAIQGAIIMGQDGVYVQFPRSA